MMKSNQQHQALPADSPEGTTIPRHIAAVLDNLLAVVFAVVAYLGYYFFTELVFSTTIAKALNGLVVRRFDGRRCSARQTAIRTATRLIEVNPILFGGLPAAISILRSRHKQRIGDKIAGTVVVRR